jgi:hypothetical protein
MTQQTCTRKVPYTVCRQVCETRTVTRTKCVPRQVCVTMTRCVPRVVCRPVQTCCDPCAGNGACGTAGCGTGAACGETAMAPVAEGTL